MASNKCDRAELQRPLAEAIRARLEAKQERLKAQRARLKAQRARLKAKQARLKAKQARLKAKQERLKAEQKYAEEKERVDQLRANIAPTNLEIYLQLVQQWLVSMLSIEPDPDKTSTGSVTSVDGKYYPLELYVWDDFPHNETFDKFMNLFSHKPLFPSKTDVLGVQGDLSLNPWWNEYDIRPLIRSAIEKPAHRVVTAYLEQSGKADRFFFMDYAHSLDNRAPQEQSDKCKVSSSSQKQSQSPEHKNTKPIPDRWGIYEFLSRDVRHVCVGEYKIARKIHTEEIKQILTSSSANLFLEVLRRKQSGFVNSDIEKTQEKVAQILCQTFHYMITSGLLYGYIILGETLIFLKIENSSPQKLYFYLTPQVVTETESPHEFEIRNAPAAQLATFATVALHSKEISRDWITKAQNCGICRWPLLPPSPLIQGAMLQPQGFDEDPSQSSEDEDEDSRDSNYNPPTERQAKTQSQQNQQISQRRQSTHQRNMTQRPILPYCTQACLLGLVKALPLDLSCPNATLHQQGQASKRHLVIKEDLCSLIKGQLACSLDEDCECLDREGLFGRIGVLFKITLTKYGYTFVAKGVQSVDESYLAHEACVYAHLSHLQGIKVPVFLGNITLEQPYPLVSLALVTKMMLMSWAGCSIGMNSWPEDVNIEKEKEETLHALTSSGISHNDIRTANLVWNPERKQVMAIDFDQATIHHNK
ncbi:hypothetical protein RJZ56_008046 [Blastomyces dermatitidis]